MSILFDIARYEGTKGFLEHCYVVKQRLCLGTQLRVVKDRMMTYLIVGRIGDNLNPLFMEVQYRPLHMKCRGHENRLLEPMFSEYFGRKYGILGGVYTLGFYQDILRRDSE